MLNVAQKLKFFRIYLARKKCLTTLFNWATKALIKFKCLTQDIKCVSRKSETTWRKNSDWKARYSQLYSSRRVLQLAPTIVPKQ